MRMTGDGRRATGDGEQLTCEQFADRLADFLEREVDEARRIGGDPRRVFAAGIAGDVVTLTRGQRPEQRSQALVVWRPRSSQGIL